MIADNERKKLAPEHIQVERIGGWIFAAVVILLMIIQQSLGLLFAWYSGTVATWILLGSLAVASFLLWIADWWPRKEYQYCAYLVNASGMAIWSGIIWRKVTSIPKARVQHTDVSQGPIQRPYGVATLIIHTAGTREAKVEVKGLPHAAAMRIRDYLIHGEEDDAS